MPTDPEHAVTRGLHVGFWAPTRELVNAFWQAGVDAGHPDDGAPGPRPEYGPDYYGGFLRDPDGNSVEAIHSERASRAGPDRPPVDPRRRPRRRQAVLRHDRAARRDHAGHGHARAGPVHRRGRLVSLVAGGRRPSTCTSPFPRPTTRPSARSTPPPSPRATPTTAPRRARRLPPWLLRRVRPGPRRPQRRGREPQPRVTGDRLVRASVFSHSRISPLCGRDGGRGRVACRA